MRMVVQVTLRGQSSKLKPHLLTMQAPASPPHLASEISTKTALVTGAGKRIGRAIALGLAKAQWNVVLHYHHSLKEAQQTAHEVRALGQQAWTVAADLSDPDQVLRLFSETLEQARGLDALINNASRFAWDGPKDVKAEGLLAHWMPNLVAPVLLSKAFYEHCSQAVAPKQGVVINLLDQKLQNPNPDFFSYTLSKAALWQATDLMARDFAPHLRVLAVSPGITMLSGDQSETGFAQAHQQTPLGRSSEPGDIVQAIVFLLHARAITGVNLLVDGGQHLQASARDVMFTTSDRLESESSL
jgi:NAD(P)-dependent dehydrogenase (short-subunit alcohol dehydrogenase family)